MEAVHLKINKFLQSALRVLLPVRLAARGRLVRLAGGLAARPRALRQSAPLSSGLPPPTHLRTLGTHDAHRRLHECRTRHGSTRARLRVSRSRRTRTARGAWAARVPTHGQDTSAWRRLLARSDTLSLLCGPVRAC